MSKGFVGLCDEFLRDHEGYFLSPLRINGSSVETIFSSLKYIAGGNLSSSNYVACLSSFATQKDTKLSQNPSAEKGYWIQDIHLHMHPEKL